MHVGETVVTLTQAAGLLAAQFPAWAALPLVPLTVAGSDNVMIRLGDDLVLRFPRLPGAVAALESEAVWLGWIRGTVPLAVPEMVAMGRPGDGYPFPWAVQRWIAGQNAWDAPVQDLAAAQALADFVVALRARPVPVEVPVKGGSLADRDGFLRQMIARLADEADPRQVARAWDTALALPSWDGAPVLVHADLHPLNLLVHNGKLAAVIDWGAFGAGDPALDLICGWTVLHSAGRALFRKRLSVDDATWARGWAFALSKAVMAAPYYRDSNPPLHAVMRRSLRRCLAERPDCMEPPLWI